jgi:putative alpha-1,2-mannosidase
MLDLGILSVLPVNRVPSESSFVDNYGYKSRFSHETETAHAGYYSVFLETHKVWAELTTGSHYSAHHRFSKNLKSCFLIMVEKKYLDINGWVVKVSSCCQSRTRCRKVDA